MAEKRTLDKDVKRSLKRKLLAKTSITTETPKIKVLKRYKKQRCIVDDCTNNAVGKGDTCRKHGGDAVIKENLLLPEEVPSNKLSTSIYDPTEHPMMFIELSREGMSTVEIAAEIGVSAQTLRGWAEAFVEFNTAYEVGQDLHEAWWLQEGKANLDNRGYNTGLYKFLTGNKLGYSDKMESKNLNISAGVLMVPTTMTVQDWEKSVGGKK